MLECVVNVAEGRDAPVLSRLATACGDTLLDLHADADHHRSVFTLAGPGPRDAVWAAASLTRAAVADLDLGSHEGVHPRLGVVDVVPFVALDEPAEVAVDAAREFAARIAAELAIPVFLYGAADPGGRDLPSVRRDAFRRRPPDLGPSGPNPRWGATAVGARPPLVAVNCWLDRDDLAVAQSVAGTVRERNGGLPGVRALGFRLPSTGHVQVSMNVTDLAATSVEAACEAVARAAATAGANVARVEWVGLVPVEAIDRCSPGFRSWSGLDHSRSIENRLAVRSG
ncbi:MAG TPA: glutamate formiminotransferase [Acidimicrobiia bacterium]|nr:glutamate formiminotransferase [Acidimicrobiia bacterium]